LTPGPDIRIVPTLPGAPGAVFAPLKRLTDRSKHHLVDPALAARLVGVGTPSR